MKNEPISVLPVKIPEDESLWSMKTLYVSSTQGEFPTLPFIGIRHPEEQCLLPEIGLGIMWSNRQVKKKEFFGFVIDTEDYLSRASLDHLLRAYRILCSTKSIDLLHRQVNTFSFCWGMANHKFDQHWERTICEWISKDTFEKLRREIFEQYSPSENERIVLFESLLKHTAPFLE
ncbi:MAG: hypothetical protein COZ29_01280 [Candidatus Moranbacteria bacterium CG_4_10_14_3_um_filter_45_9]|nr:MAG: hypothetical protein AUK19_01450 [Candidatus Moranbacteria bacterium CG2_30_45_14]PIX90191.1 MAG: hypothetical protein COZ29_01280 [Candidatus Moranbacteria bacterium CG_4_10_14_3_um_filter_45_9]PJA86048.1 MAG: hypothetical protein CO143_00065 [Candidatus Moranbacteria bacterium CG_4_9_14_3_um_filter_45_14]